ncbi:MULTISPECIES: DUF4190 domain-containing protein [unclassified Lentimonas]|uniref:DUF4190 domain-containing protein n=1 Tax=unclassified Lentimonas TaxID=2630993 RepID=UPI001323D005|nr:MULTISPECIES: DUF4190 domain-containing protein [unclassified Lentimonas]CAA6690573.1 Unannotated [Lentimonas sp. CC10]CAA6695325.1 Unannotated [Lentimonas sp. CC19]CAA7068830.1 Unannotated [Lentimonas sp. CC11]
MKTNSKNSPSTSKLAVTCCSAAIISAGCFPYSFILSVIPIVIGHMALSGHKQNPDLNGRELALVGISVGYALLAIGIILHAGAYLLFNNVTIETVTN